MLTDGQFNLPHWTVNRKK